MYVCLTYGSAWFITSNVCYAVAFIFLPNKLARTGNVFMWVALFIGNGMLMCLYSMEWYARRRCPANPVCHSSLIDDASKLLEYQVVVLQVGSLFSWRCTGPYVFTMETDYNGRYVIDNNISPMLCY